LIFTSFRLRFEDESLVRIKAAGVPPVYWFLITSPLKIPAICVHQMSGPVPGDITVTTLRGRRYQSFSVIEDPENNTTNIKHE
jgi:hypothetical protein